MDYENLSSLIIKYIGGKDNISSLTHCITRLRFVLKDVEKADVAAIDRLDGVIKTVISGGQHQVVIGNHVTDVFSVIQTILGWNASEHISDSKNESMKKTNIFDQFIVIVSGIFTPVLGIMAAAGMLKGLCALFLATKILDPSSGTYNILYAMGDSFFYFLPIILGFLAAKKFGCNVFVGMAIGASLLYPALDKLKTAQPLYTLFKGSVIESPIITTFMDIPVILANYASTVIPVIFAVFFAAKIERVLSRLIPDMLKTFFLPFFTLLISVPVTFIVIGPVTTWLSQALGYATTSLITLNPVIAGLFLGGFWQVFVMFGLHWGIIPLALNNVATLGQDVILPLMLGTTFSQAGIVAALFLTSKDNKFKSIAAPAFISAMFGVTEPAIYGVTLPRKYPFILSCIISSIAGGFLGFMGTRLYTLGGLGVFTYPSHINPTHGIDMGFWGAIIATVGSFAIGFILMLLIGSKSKK